MPGTGLGALAFVIAGLIVRRAYRYGSSPARPEGSRRRIASFALALMVGAVVVGSVAAQSVFRERTDDALPQPETAVLAASVLVLGAGVGLRAGATRTRSVHVTGVRGSAFVHAIKPVGIGVKGLPIYEMDLDVSAPGVAPFRAEYREAIPAMMAETIQEGEPVPVLVDPSTRRIALDWISPRSGVAADGFGKRPPVRDVPSPVAPPPPSPLGAAATVAPRVVPVVVTIVLLGLGTTVLNRIFESDDATVTVTPADHASTDLGATPVPTGRVAADHTTGGRRVSYSLAVPDGWEEDPAPRTDVLLRSHDGETTLVVARPARFNRRPLPPGSDVEAALPLVYRDLGDSLGAAQPVTIDGSAGVQFDVRDPEQGRTLVVVVREGSVFFVTLSYPRGQDADPVLQQVLDSWAWG
jgi:hypothetical protein